MSDSDPTTAEAEPRPEQGEVVWSLWLALGMLVLWVLLLFGIPIMTLSLAMALRIGANPNPGELQAEFEAIQSSPLFPVGLVLCSLLGWIILFGVLGMLFRDAPKPAFRRALGIRPAHPSWTMAAAIGFGVATCLFAQLLAGVLPEPDAATGFEEMLTTVPGKVSLLFLAIFLAPPAEELFFRGFLFPPMARQFSPVWAILINSGVFAVIHVGSYGFESAYLVPVFLLGVLAAILRVWTGSIWPSILAHAAFNATSLGLYLLFNPSLSST